jgi:hypothetical protein
VKIHAFGLGEPIPQKNQNHPAIRQRQNVGTNNSISGSACAKNLLILFFGKKSIPRFDGDKQVERIDAVRV